MIIICKYLDINNLLMCYFDNKLLNDFHKNNKFCTNFSGHNFEDNYIIFAALIVHARHLSVI